MSVKRAEHVWKREDTFIGGNTVGCTDGVAGDGF